MCRSRISVADGSQCGHPRAAALQLCGGATCRWSGREHHAPKGYPRVRQHFATSFRGPLGWPAPNVSFQFVASTKTATNRLCRCGCAGASKAPGCASGLPCVRCAQPDRRSRPNLSFCSTAVCLLPAAANVGIHMQRRYSCVAGSLTPGGSEDPTPVRAIPVCAIIL